MKNRSLLSLSIFVITALATQSSLADVQPAAVAALTAVVSSAPKIPDNNAVGYGDGVVMTEQKGGVDKRYDVCGIYIYGNNQIAIAAQVNEKETPFRLSTGSIFNMGEKVEVYSSTFSKATLTSTQLLGADEYQLNFKNDKKEVEEDMTQAEFVEIRIKNNKLKSVAMKVSGFFSDKKIICAFQ